MIYHIIPKTFATKKTKERIQQHGNLWVLQKTVNGLVLLEACSDKYLKWFIRDEIIMESKGELDV